MSGKAKSPRAPISPLNWVMIAVSIVVLFLMVTVPLDWKDQVLFGCATVAMAYWINQRSTTPTGTMTLVFISVFCTLRYANWRFSETWRQMSAQGLSNLQWDVVFVLLLLLAEAYAIIVLLLGYFQSLRPLHRDPKPLPADPASWPTVDVYIPSYNEPLDLVRPTVLAALNIDWPPEKLKVYILDDGRRPDFRAFAEERGVGYMIRPDNKGAKAGNINHAMRHTSGEYIAIFDCDHVPTRSFLQMTMGLFMADRRLSTVQTPHYFYTPDPFEKNLGIFGKVPNEGALFYGVLQDANDFWDATFFCGSCAVIRREALEEVGGIAVETVTEDSHTALRMHRRGWRSAYIRFPQAAGLATSSLADHIGQRIRWARGMVQILRLDFPLLGRGLSFAQRLCYLNATLHYLYALPRLIFLTAPLCYLLLNRSNVYGYVGTILAYAIPHLALATTTNSRIQGRFRYSYWNEVYETVLAPYILLPTMAALVSPRHGKFNVTPKSLGSDRTYFAWKVAVPLLLLLALNLSGIIYGGLRILTEPERTGPLCMNMLWAVLNVIILGASVAVASERRQRRKEARLERHHGAHLIMADGRISFGETLDLSTRGAAISLRSPEEFPAGMDLTLLIAAPGGEVAVHARVTGGRASVVRLNFHNVTISQLEGLTRIIFGDANLWLFGHHAQTPDRPWRSFLQIVRISLDGILMVPRLLFWREAEPAPPTAGPVRGSQPGLPIAVIALLGLSMFMTALPALAKSPLQGQPAAAPAANLIPFEETRDLRSLGLRQPLTFKGADTQATFRFALPATKIATNASLGLSYRLSPALPPNNTVFNVLLNGSPVATVPLDRSGAGASGYSYATVVLPPELLLAQNTLVFQLRSRDASVVAAEEDVLTVIDPSSVLHISGDVAPLPNDLSRFPSPFFESDVPSALQLSFVFPPDANLTDMRAAGLLASYFGSLANYRGAHMPVTQVTLPKGNAVVLAPAGSPLLSGLALDQLSGPTVAVRKNPADPAAKLLIITGLDSTQMLDAAMALVQGGGRRAGDTMTITSAPSLPPVRRAYDVPRWLPTGAVIRLGDQLKTEELRVEGTGVVQWYFRLPPDMHFGARELVPLRLHCRYASLPRGSRAEIRTQINGIQIGMRRLDAASSSDTFRELIQIPAISLYPQNTLTIDFQYFDDTGQRVRRGSGAPVGIVMRDSEMDLSALAHYTRLPRLDLFAKGGYPFTRFADLSHTAVVMPPHPAPEELSAYLEVMSFFGAQTGCPAFYLDVADDEQAAHISGKDLLVFGTVNSQPLYRRWADFMPLRMEPRGFSLNRPSSTWLQLRSFPISADGRSRGRLASLLEEGSLDGLVLQSFVSPLNPQQSVVLISASTVAQFATTGDLLEAGRVGDIPVTGNVVVGSQGVHYAFQVPARDFYLGELGWRETIDNWVVRYLWLALFVLILFALVLARSAVRWADAHAEARLRIEQ